jgi:hypothetical protein
MALDMVKAGKTAKEVLDSTGWELTKDGKWQHKLKTKPVLLKRNEITKHTTRKGTYDLSDLVFYDELFNNYPQLKDLKVEVLPELPYTAIYKDNVIKVNGKVLAEGTHLDILAILGHETQHAIQDIEGFSTGTNPVDARKTPLYASLTSALRSLKLNPNLATEVLKDKKNTYAVVKELGISENLIPLMEEMAKLVKNEDDPSGLEVWAMKQAYLAKLGEVQARDAEKHWGGLEVAQTQESLIYYNKNTPEMGIGGMYIPALGMSFINAEVVPNEKALVATFYHEVAAHAYLDMVKSEEYNTLLAKVEKLHERGLKSSNEKVMKFFQRIDKDLVNAGNVGNKEELFAYMLQASYELLNDHMLYDMEKDVNSNLEKLKGILPEVVVSALKQIAALYTKHMRKLFSSSSAMQVIKGVVTEDIKFNLEIQEDLLSLVEGSKRAVDSVASRRSQHKANLGAYDSTLVTDTTENGANYVKNNIGNFAIIAEMLGLCR